MAWIKYISPEEALDASRDIVLHREYRYSLGKCPWREHVGTGERQPLGIELEHYAPVSGMARSHALIAWEEGAWRIKDTSIKGTLLNGAFIARNAAVVLRRGDTFTLGTLRHAPQYEFHQDEAQPATMDRTDRAMVGLMVGMPMLVASIAAFLSGSVVIKGGIIMLNAFFAFTGMSEMGEHRARAAAVVLTTGILVAFASAVLPHIALGRPWRWGL